MGLDHKGRIAPGCDADLVFLDGDLRVRRTMVAGRVVFQA
jgi:beta-aspartyl-dipeptidase (metallo-type)